MAEDELFTRQVDRLRLPHFLILYWAAQAEVENFKYNITNAFDDLKEAEVTRTKQSAMAYVDALSALCFVDVRDESNRKNIYITEHGTLALERLVALGRFKVRASRYLEVGT